MSWTAIAVLALGAYLFKAIGVLVLGPLAARPATGAGDAGGPDGTDGAGGWPLQLGQLLPPALLAALVVNQTMADGQDLVLDARLAGVAVGAVAVWRGAPFWLVILVAAAVTAGIRAIAG